MSKWPTWTEIKEVENLSYRCYTCKSGTSFFKTALTLLGEKEDYRFVSKTADSFPVISTLDLHMTIMIEDNSSLSSGSQIPRLL
jgi:hypothetical protein